MPPTGYKRHLPALAPIALFALMCALYAAGQMPIYYFIIKTWGVSAFTWPFEDTETVMSALRCIREGVDVYAANPCDPELRPFDYSPLWMALSVFPVTHSWLNPAGLLVDVTFLASLFLLPAGRDAEATGWTTFAALSSGVFFAVERGNNDLVLFTLAALAAALMGQRWGRRCIGYALLFLAGLLKFYPMLTMAIALRERPPRFFALAALSAAGLAIFLAITWPDLSRVLQIIPIGDPFHDMFGSVVAGVGVMAILEWPREEAVWIHVPLIAISLIIAVRLGLQERTAQALASLTERERNFLLIGALLTVACFFTAQNIGYRVVHMVLALPALLALSKFGPERRFRWMPWIVIASLWGEFWRRLGRSLAALFFGNDTAMAMELWLLKEALWWFLATVFVSYLIAFALRSTMGIWLVSLSKARVRRPVFSAA